MILYLGTTNLVKLYVAEPASNLLRDWVGVAEIVATSKIAFTEIMAAINFRYTRGDLTEKDRERLTEIVVRDWAHFVKVDFDDIEAGGFVKKYGLTRFGAIHLSSARLIKQEQYKLPSLSKKSYKEQSEISLFFVSSDETLCKAAASEGLKVLPLC